MILICLKGVRTSRRGRCCLLGSYRKVSMKEASFSFLFSFPYRGQQFTVKLQPPRSLCSTQPSLIRVLCVEVKKLSNFVKIKCCDNSKKRKKKEAQIPNFAEVWQLTQSKCCRLEGRIGPCKVTCPISTDRFMLIGGPAIISPFITLTDNGAAVHGAAFTLRSHTHWIPSHCTIKGFPCSSLCVL